MSKERVFFITVFLGLLLVITPAVYLPLTTKAQRLMNAIRATIGYVEKGRILNAYRSTS